MSSLFQQLLEKSESNVSSYGRDISLNYHRNKKLEAQKDSESDEEEISFTREKKKKARKRKKPQLTANLSGTRYDIIRHAAEKYGFSLAKEEDFQNCFLIWSDNFVSTERVSELKSFQKINHFPGMSEICRKDFLARNMAKMSKAHGDEYNFVPRTWVMPQEQSQFHNYLKDLKKNNKKKTFIIKPCNGAMGNGIRLMKCTDPIPQGENLILQEYIDKPFLVDGYKCDMRIYVLVTSCDPLRVFLFNDGLLRMSTERYIHPNEGNMGKDRSSLKKDALFMHLTNYSVNKRSGKYQRNDDDSTGSKRSLRFLNEYLRRHHYDIHTLWKNIIEVIIKTMVVAAPHLLHAYRMCRPGQSGRSGSVCFEVLGFDILLDKKLRPWLLEVNRSPSFGCDEKIDRDVKLSLLTDTLRLINIRASDKRKDMAEQKAQTQKRLLKSSTIGRVDYNGNVDLMKRQKSVERKKDSLQDLLVRIRRESARDEFESRNGGRFRRVFPPEDRLQHQRYIDLLMSSFATFLYSSTSNYHKEIEYIYDRRLDEHEVMEMLAACEAEETNLGIEPVKSRFHDSDAGDKPPKSAPAGLSRSQRHQGDDSARTQGYKRRINAILLPSVDISAPSENEPLNRVFTMLNELNIKFPGKSDEDAENVLIDLTSHWMQNKQKIANYWLVKLDSTKRKKVIDIVRSNISYVFKRCFNVKNVETVRLYRIINRVFNRLLWSNGQGLWECFSSNGSWETIFIKSTEQISPIELACCRRIVKLCKDCLLIVYQFALENAQGRDTIRSHSIGLGEMSMSSEVTITRPATSS